MFLKINWMKARKAKNSIEAINKARQAKQKAIN